MNKQFGRLLLAGVCALIVAPAATAQDSPPPSHRLFDPDFSNLSQAESLLARRLRHQEDMQRLQELVKGLSKATPQERQEFQDIIKNHPEIADDPELFGLLNKAKEFKENGFLSSKMREELGRQAKDFLNKLKEKDSASPNSTNEGPPDLTHPPTDELIHPPDITPPPIVPKPEGMGNEIKQGLTDLIKKIETSSEGEALRDKKNRNLLGGRSAAQGRPERFRQTGNGAVQCGGLVRFPSQRDFAAAGELAESQSETAVAAEP
jgi:hypothetical protein